MTDKIIAKKRDKSLNTVLLFLKRVKKYLLYSLGILVCMSKFNAFSSLSVTILSGIGILATVLGLAAKESLTNLFGSLGLIFGHPFEVGDYISCVDKKIEGIVEEITMRHTIIKTLDNKRIIVPNSVMNNLSIENYNHTDNEVCLYDEYPISYEADLNKAIEILKEETAKLYHPNPNGKNKDVEFPRVRLVRWDSSSLILRTWVWGKNIISDQENVFHLNEIIKNRFNQENIEIPYDKLDVNLKK